MKRKTRRRKLASELDYRKFKRSELQLHLFLSPTHEIRALADYNLNDRDDYKYQIIDDLSKKGDEIQKRLRRASTIIRKLCNFKQGWQLKSDSNDGFHPFGVSLICSQSVKESKKQLKKLGIDPSQPHVHLSEGEYTDSLYNRKKKRRKFKLQ